MRMDGPRESLWHEYASRVRERNAWGCWHQKTGDSALILDSVKPILTLHAQEIGALSRVCSPERIRGLCVSATEGTREG
jgi:hypothetical protein